MDSSIGLADFVSQVKMELLEPDPRTTNATPLLSLEQVDLELQVTVSKDASGRVRVYVVDAGGGLKREDVQRVKLTLQPLVSREDRVALLRQRADWSDVVDVAMQGALKGADASTNQRAD
jgi:hypothetical protein